MSSRTGTMRVLLIGASGQLGHELVRHNPGHTLHAPARSELDIGRTGEAARMIASLRPELVINCAAFHHLPLCEEDPLSAFRINCVAVRELATACAANAARFVSFSSDYVFGSERALPWREDDAPAPLQVYGISRLAGEFAALAAAPQQAIIVRTCGLYGHQGSRSRGGNFVDARIRDARAGVAFGMACEQMVSPTSASDLAAALWQLLAEPRCTPGIYHLVNEGACSWYEFTREILRLLGSSTELYPVDRGACSDGMRRPRYSALANTRASALGVRLRPWQEALADYLFPVGRNSFRH